MRKFTSKMVSIALLACVSASFVSCSDASAKWDVVAHNDSIAATNRNLLVWAKLQLISIDAQKDTTYTINTKITRRIHRMFVKGDQIQDGNRLYIVDSIDAAK
jgi:hypothetical protein